jgi:chorismate lyase/3-hydroxybenzoate synthase
MDTSASQLAAEAIGKFSHGSGSLVPAWVAEYALPSLRHVTADFDDARAMDSLLFQMRVAEAYERIFEQLESAMAHPVRFWAFVPGIHDDLGAGLDRYMAFNAGRYGAFTDHFGRPTSFATSVPTASAVGVIGDRFSLHCLGADTPGVPVENPRQISAYHYSRRFGPMPPCFSRATLVRGEARAPMLIVGGTASITGEESRHLDALDAQARETFRNLASVVASAAGHILPEDAPASEIESLLNGFRDLRVYYTNPSHQGFLAELMSATFSRCRVEWLQASLCRPELLVEIEGVAFLATDASARTSAGDS